ncbi:MAG TPA: prepilin-type N-terminal cleavage/methylation domain-containing protein, partial [Patescibacteria group bacterium]|nr:prepilin-type N-terminal cleavage/methylation domain-containing protein [Patescibacteria group bacterium]
MQTQTLFRNQEAFTIIELIISVSIVAIISALVIPNFKDFREKKALESQTQLAIGHLRELQNAVMTGKNFENVSSEGGYGMRITLARPDRMFLFADLNSDRVLSGNEELIEGGEILLIGDIVFSNFE